jgi:hypothetical protein
MPSLTFAHATAEVVDFIYGSIEAGDEEARYVKDPARLEEAAEIEPVAEAFARAEVEAGGKGLGIYGANMIPAIGQQLGKRLGKRGPEAIEAAVDAVKRALGVGYVGFVSVEAPSGIHFVADVDHEQVWNLTVHNFRAEGLRRLGLPAPLCKTIEEMGEDVVKRTLRDADLLGFRSGRVGLVGRYYGHAGGWMRAAQTDLEISAKATLMADTLAERWPWGSFAPAS